MSDRNGNKFNAKMRLLVFELSWSYPKYNPSEQNVKYMLFKVVLTVKLKRSYRKDLLFAFFCTLPPGAPLLFRLTHFFLTSL